VPDLDEEDEEDIVANLVHHSIIPFSHSPQVAARDREFPGIRRPRILPQEVYSFPERNLQVSRKFLELALRGRRELDRVWRHGFA
jgi:hypothetical protein